MIYYYNYSELTVELDEKSSRDSRREKRKILPSSDLLSDCDIDPTLKSLQPTDPESSSGCGDGTPNYPDTPDSTDSEEVFDNELEMLGTWGADTLGQEGICPSPPPKKIQIYFL